MKCIDNLRDNLSGKLPWYGLFRLNLHNRCLGWGWSTSNVIPGSGIHRTEEAWPLNSRKSSPGKGAKVSRYDKSTSGIIAIPRRERTPKLACLCTRDRKAFSRTAQREKVPAPPRPWDLRERSVEIREGEWGWLCRDPARETFTKKKKLRRRIERSSSRANRFYLSCILHTDSGFTSVCAAFTLKVHSNLVLFNQIRIIVNSFRTSLYYLLLQCVVSKKKNVLCNINYNVT